MRCRRHILVVWCCAVVAVALAGCTSKWAMSDPEYAAKYSEPYTGDHADKVARMAKQAVDARFMDGRTGVYVGGMGQSQPAALGAEIGVFHYFREDMEGRASLAWLADSAAEDDFLGVNLGARYQTPSRLAPFVGLGTFAGYSKQPTGDKILAPHTDGNGLTYYSEEDEQEFDGALMAVYPEFGAHFWLTPNVRLTGSASYYVTTEGRNHDFWMYGLNLGWAYW